MKADGLEILVDLLDYLCEYSATSFLTSEFTSITVTVYHSDIDVPRILGVSWQNLEKCVVGLLGMLYFFRKV